MSNLATLRATIKAALHKNSPHVDAAIAEAMQHVRNEELWFNGAHWKFTTTAGQVSYPLPEDYLGVRELVWIKAANEADDARRPLTPMTLADLERYRFYFYDDFGENWLSDDAAGTPNGYAMDLVGKFFLLAPKPATGGDEVYFRYTKDLGTPQYTAAVTSSASPSLVTTVTLLGPDGQTLPTTFTNEWFKNGLNLLRDRALYILFTLYHAGTEQATSSAQAALMRYLEELARIRGETQQIQSVTQFTPFI